MPPGLTWLDYVQARGLSFPEGATWADLPPREARRLTRNWRRWQRRRRAASTPPPLHFALEGDRVVLQEPGTRR